MSTDAHPLVSGPILRTLLRLAAPNVMATSMAVLVGLAETFSTRYTANSWARWNCASTADAARHAGAGPQLHSTLMS